MLPLHLHIHSQAFPSASNLFLAGRVGLSGSPWRLPHTTINRGIGLLPHR